MDLIQKNLSLDNLEDEIWKQHPSFSKYKISNYGRIYSNPYKVYLSFKSMWVDKKGKILSQSNDNSKKYWRIGLITNAGNRFAASTHRLVAETFIPNPNNLSQVNHIDGNKDNNHVSNLEWSSNEDNMLHSFRLGLHTGKNNKGKSILTPEQVMEIVTLLPLYDNSYIATLYYVKPNSINEIRQGRSWSDITKIQMYLTSAIEKYPIVDRFKMYELVKNKIVPSSKIKQTYSISTSTLNNICKWCEQNPDLNE